MGIVAEVLKICVTSLVSIAVLFLICRLIGQRQISQLSMFDYINSITVGSIAAELATDLEQWWQPLTATIVYGIATLLINLLSCKSLKLRRFISGKPLILYQDGKLYKQNLLRARLNVNEFLSQCRMAGYFDLNQLEAAVLETSGIVSFMPKSQDRPATPKDLSLCTKRETLSYNIILDGKILFSNLKQCGRDISWLKKQLQQSGFASASDVFLATCDKEGNFTAFQMDQETRDRTLF